MIPLTTRFFHFSHHISNSTSQQDYWYDLFYSESNNFAYEHLGKKIRWEGKGVEEKGYDSETGKLIVAVDSRYFRPTEVETLLGDPSKAKEKLGWEPKISLEQMVKEMMEHDINIAKRDALVKEHGFEAPDFNE